MAFRKCFCRYRVERFHKSAAHARTTKHSSRAPTMVASFRRAVGCRIVKSASIAELPRLAFGLAVLGAASTSWSCGERRVATQPTGPTPAVIAAAAGNYQTALPGSSVPIDPAVQVNDAFSKPLPGVAVSFAVAS